MASPGQPDFIRFFATTDNSAIGVAALEYAKAMCRVAPVRVITMSGALVGPWSSFTELVMTPMEGIGMTAVCCDPSRWVWSLKVPAPDKDATTAEMAAAKVREHIHGVRELYTAGQRNVLFAITTPRDHRQLETAEKYNEIVVPSDSHVLWWAKVSTKRVRVIGTPVVAHDAIRAALGFPFADAP